MSVRVIAFARARELLGFNERDVALVDAATVGALRSKLEREAPKLVELRGSTRVARNGELVDDTAPLADGDEVALLPPVGGG